MLRRVNAPSWHWLLWSLVALLPWLGLGMAQRQTLGPLHVHVAPTESTFAGEAGPFSQALDWWWAQVQQQAHARRHAHAHAQGHAHSHDSWQRHHHAAADDSVVTLDGPGEDLGNQVTPAALLLPMWGPPAGGPKVPADAGRALRWMPAGPARFSSWGTAPPLRPPRA